MSFVLVGLAVGLTGFGVGVFFGDSDSAQSSRESSRNVSGSSGSSSQTSRDGSRESSVSCKNVSRNTSTAVKEKVQVVKDKKFSYSYRREGEYANVTYGNMSSRVSVAGELSWIPVIVRKLKNYKDDDGSYPMAGKKDEELRPLATILGDPEAFYNHFFAGKFEIDSRLREDIEDIQAGISQSIASPMSAEEVQDLLERQVSTMNNIARGNGSLEAAMTFTELGGGALQRALGNVWAKYGYVHASLVLNGVTTVEWGSGDLGPSIVSPRVASRENLGLSLVFFRRESKYHGLQTAVASAVESAVGSAAVGTAVGTVVATATRVASSFISFVLSLFTLFSMNESDLRKLAKLATSYNRRHHYNPVTRNCQNFLDDVVHEISDREVKFGPVLTKYLNNIQNGSAKLAVPSSLPNDQHNVTEEFDSLQEINEFVEQDNHNGFSVEQRYLLGMFHTMLTSRFIHDNDEPGPMPTSHFPWMDFKREAATALGAAVRRV